MIKYIFVFLTAAVSVNAQTDWVRWKAVDVSYEFEPLPTKNYSFDESSFGSLFISGAKNIYYFTISDLDGDNCPFHPSCSNFFVQSVKETNIFQGALMFADRFMRDTNLFKSRTHYPMHKSGKFYDPINNYELHRDKIKYIPYNKTITN